MAVQAHASRTRPHRWRGHALEGGERRTSSPVVQGAGRRWRESEEIGWDGTEQWSFSVATPKNLVHHDAVQIPNGNILVLVWERHEPDEAQSKGRDADKVGKAGLWSECLWELQPQGEKGARIVWEWKAWNHVRRFPSAHFINRHEAVPIIVRTALLRIAKEKPPHSEKLFKRMPLS